MKLKFKAQIMMGELRFYSENDAINPLYKVNVETSNHEDFKMVVSDNKDNPLGEVFYKEGIYIKFLVARNYIVNDLENQERIDVKADSGSKLFIGKDGRTYLTRSRRDRKMLLYKDNRLIMVLKCRTIFRNWLRGDYVAAILDDNYVVFCLCVISMILNIIFDEHNCTSFNL